MTIRIQIDGKTVPVAEGATVLAAARAAGVYIPTLCHHDDLPAAPDQEACGLCLVVVAGEAEPVRACATAIRDGLRVTTASPDLSARRKRALGRILATHPHACLTCAQAEGCAREPCSSNVPAAERCCPVFADCELRRLAAHVGVPADLPRYVPAGLPVTEEPLYVRDPNLCVACGRCVRACADLRGVAALARTEAGGRTVVLPKAGTLPESGCRYCGTCAEVCPTGAIRDRNLPSGDREKALVPCRAACPAGVDVPLYVSLIADGQAAEAARVVRDRVPFPTVLGHVCYRPCEEVCRRGGLSGAVAICDLKRVAGESGEGDAAPGAATGRSVAVAGAGPAGLAAAFYLRRLGHAVTVLDPEPAPGGMLRYAIPRERLPREALDRDLAILERLGVSFRTGARFEEVAGSLAGAVDAVVLATGAGPAKRLDFPGADGPGVETALSFLRAAVNGSPPDLAGRRVLVVGGGNVAMDAAGAAARAGAASVTVVCLEAPEEMPAHPSEVEAARAAGVAFRHRLGPLAARNAGGGSSEIDFARCTAVFDAAGRFAPRFAEGVAETLPADLVLLAVGQRPDDGARRAAERLGVPVVVAGDAAAGPANVTEGVASGRRAALEVHARLGCPGGLEDRRPERLPPGRLAARAGFDAVRRAAGPLTGTTAVAEADRCLRCHLRLAVAEVPAPPEDVIPFRAEETSRVPAAAGVLVLLDAKKTTLFVQGAPDLRAAWIAALSSPDFAAAKHGRFEEDEMYTRRESEILSRHLAAHGSMPAGNAPVPDDLF